MIKNIQYWIWLQCCLGTDSKKLCPAVEFFGSAENIYYAKESDYRYAGFFTEREITKLLDKNLDYAEKTAEVCLEKGYSIVPFGSREYPSRLAEIPTPPVVLYVYGKLPRGESFHVGMVGTRNPDETGKQLAYNFAYDLAKEQAVIVSGGAYGIDVFSHMGCIDAGGATVCVIGCGIDRFDLKVSKYLLEEVPKNGAVVSEYPPGYPPTKFTFPTRDRIISGMSDCTLVVQAGMGSGALITAKCAVEQNKKIFAVSGNAAHKNSTGSNFLIANGFSAVLSYRDIVYWNRSERERQTIEGRLNPQTDSGFFRRLAVKVDDIQRHGDPERRLIAPVGYDVFVSLEDIDAAKTDADDRQMKLPDTPETEIDDAEKGIGEAEEIVTIEESLHERALREQAEDKGIEAEVDRELANMKHEDFTSLRGALNYRLRRRQMIFERKKALNRYRDVEFDREHQGELSEELLIERDRIRLTELSVRALKREPEPEGSYITAQKKDTMVSEEQLRAMEINRLTRLLNKGSGIHDLTKENLRKVYMPSVRYDTEDSSEYVIPERKNTGRDPEKNVSEITDAEQDRGHIAKNDKNTSKHVQKEGKNGKNNEKKEKFLSEQLTENASAVYDTISDTPIHVDIIKLKTGLSIATVLSAVTELQVFGLVEKLPGRRYIRN